MVGLNDYRSLDDLDDKRRRALESLLRPNETFIYGIDIYDVLLLPSRRATKLILTDTRVIEFKRAFVKEVSRDFDIQEVATVEHRKGWIKREITLEGHSFEVSYETRGNVARQFVTAMREQQRRRRDDEDAMPSAAIDDPELLTEDPPELEEVEVTEVETSENRSRLGSWKIHAVVAVLTIWWAYGVVNVLYAGYAYSRYRGLDERLPINRGRERSTVIEEH